jgi:hypothetical protein
MAELDDFLVVSGKRYLAVSEGEPAGETKGPVPKPLIPSLRAHPAMSRARGGGKPVRAFLSYYTAGSGAANTAYNSGAVIQPNQDSSWASWQAVFDEFRVVQAEAIWNVYYTTDPTVVPANSANSIVVYDPTNSVALASVNAGLQFEHYSLLRCMIPTATGPKVSPMVVTRDGFAHLKITPPSGVINSAVDTTNSGSNNWRPTADAVNYNWGSFIGYTSVGGVSAVLRNEYFVRMLVEFRVRR